MSTWQFTDAVMVAIPSFKLMSERIINPDKYFATNRKSSTCLGSDISTPSSVVDNCLNSLSKTLGEMNARGLS